METHRRISLLVEVLDQSIDSSPDQYAETLSLLEVEILDHLQYHVQALRDCFPGVLEAAYSQVAKTGSTPEEYE
jgi:hypothetical protein